MLRTWWRIHMTAEQRAVMHTLFVRILVLAFEEAMEYWGRGDPVPGYIQDIVIWVNNRDINAHYEAQAIIFG